MSAASTSVLHEKLAALRRRHAHVEVVTGLSFMVLLAAEVLALAMFVDWWIELPRWIRFILLFAQFSGASFVFIILVLIPWVRRPGDDELALMVERARPEFRSRLIASVQLARPDGAAPNTSTSLVSALVEETSSRAAGINFSDIIPLDRLKWLAFGAVLVLVLGLSALKAGGNSSWVLLRRIALSNEPVPRKTRVIVPENERVVGVGDTVRLEAYAQGLLPRQGRLEVKHRSRRAQEFTLEQNRENPGHFGRSIENVQEDFNYQFTLGDAVSAEHRVRVVPRPGVGSIECEQTFPSYTGLKAANRRPGDLSLLAGSVLAVKIAATKPVSFGELRLVGVESNVALRLDAATGRELTGSFQVSARGLTGFQVHMIDGEGLESRDAAVYRVDIVPDKPPVVRVTSPDRKEELLTRQAALLIGFEATDDFQVAELRLFFKLAADDSPEKSVELDLADARAAKLRRRYEWRPSEFLPEAREGSVIEYWLEARDNNSVTGPGVAISERQLVKVVSEAEKRADLLNRASDFLGSINDLVADQEKLNRNLGEAIRAKAGLR